MPKLSVTDTRDEQVEAVEEAFDLVQDVIEELADTLSTTHVPVTVDRSIVVGNRNEPSRHPPEPPAL